MGLGAALEVLSVSHRLSDERVLHHDGVEEEVGDENADCKYEHSGVWGNLAGGRCCEVEVHSVVNEGAEE